MKKPFLFALWVVHMPAWAAPLVVDDVVTPDGTSLTNIAHRAVATWTQTVALGESLLQISNRTDRAEALAAHTWTQYLAIAEATTTALALASNAFTLSLAATNLSQDALAQAGYAQTVADLASRTSNIARAEAADALRAAEHATTIALAASNRLEATRSEIPQMAWELWGTPTGTFHVSGPEWGILYSSSNFAEVLNWTLANVHPGAAIEIGAHPTNSAFFLDRPVWVDRVVTLRGKGNYGTHIHVADGYRGPLIVIGSNATLSGIVRIERIRFEGSPDNTHPIIDVQGCAEPNIAECEFTSHAGPAIRVSSSKITVHWAEIERCWFVARRNIGVPYIFLEGTGPQGIQEFAIQGCKARWAPLAANVGPLLEVTGAVRSLRITGNSFWRTLDIGYGTTSPVIVVRGGRDILIAANAFSGLFSGRVGIVVSPPISNMFNAAIVANNFEGTTNGAVAVWVTSNAYGVLVAANHLGGGIVSNEAPWVPTVHFGDAVPGAPLSTPVGETERQVLRDADEASSIATSTSSDLSPVPRMFVSGCARSDGSRLAADDVLVFDLCPPPASHVFLGMDWVLTLQTNQLSQVPQWWTNVYLGVSAALPTAHVGPAL